MKHKKPWQHAEVLEGLYNGEGLTIRDIAKILETTPSNIMYWMKKFDIQTRQFEIGNVNRGKTMSDEARARLSEMAKRRFTDPKNHPMYGHKHSEISRRKMSEAKLKKPQED